MSNSLTECVETNGCCCNGCGTCNYCQGLELSDTPTKNRVSANTTLLGTDSYGYPVEAIKNYIILGNTGESRATFATDTDTATLGLKTVYGCTDTTAPRVLTVSTETIQSGTAEIPKFFQVVDEDGNASPTNTLTVTFEGAVYPDVIIFNNTTNKAVT